MAINRTFSFGGFIYANNAATPVPGSPVNGTPYRLGADFIQSVIESGAEYNTVADSAEYNEALYRLSQIALQLETQGVLSWSATQVYPIGALVFGSDDKLYRSLSASNLNNDPSSSPSDWVAETNAEAGGDAGGIFSNLLVTGIQGRAWTNIAPTNNQIPIWNNANSRFEYIAFPTALPPNGAASGDLSGSYPSPTVAQVQGRPWTAGAPASGNYVYWNGSQFDYRSLPVASESAQGISERATQTEANTGTDDERHITPAKLHNKTVGGMLSGTISNATVGGASTTTLGVVEIATQAEVDAGADTSRVVTPETLKNRDEYPNSSYLFGSGTFNVPVGVNKVRITAIGGGGGGGGSWDSNPNGAGGGGGAAGGVVICEVNTSSISSFTYATGGAGGGGGSSSSPSAGSGGFSSSGQAGGAGGSGSSSASGGGGGGETYLEADTPSMCIVRASGGGGGGGGSVSGSKPGSGGGGGGGHSGGQGGDGAHDIDNDFNPEICHGGQSGEVGISSVDAGALTGGNFPGSGAYGGAGVVTGSSVDYGTVNINPGPGGLKGGPPVSGSDAPGGDRGPGWDGAAFGRGGDGAGYVDAVGQDGDGGAVRFEY